MGKKIISFIFGIPITVIALMGVLGSLFIEGENSPLPVFISLLIFGVLLIIMGIRSKSKAYKIKELDASIHNNDNTNKKMYKLNHLNADHVSGLPLAENTECVIGLEADRFSFLGGGNEFSLHFDKMTGIDVKTDVEIKNQNVSSVGGAVGGALLFGPLGAIVGGRSKAKATTTLSYYLIFTYLKEESIAFISFEISYSFLQKARAFKDMYYSKYHQSNSITVEL